MILYQWRGHERNFGDELNGLLWPALLPGFFDDDPAARFLGIGSILDNRHPAGARTLVAGSGYGGYEAPPTLDETWTVHWVRGPHTARLLGLPPSLALGDPGSLIPLIGPEPPRERRGIGFMPHFESAARGAWAEVADAAGLTLIDPRGDPAAILASVARCGTLISEALHGVIVADALRVPWIAIEPLAPVHRSKWADWADTLDLRIAFHRLPPSTLLERAHLSGLSRYHAGRGVLSHQAARLRDLARGRYIDRAAQALGAAAAAEPRLSRPAALERSQARMMDAVAALRLAPRPRDTRDRPRVQPDRATPLPARPAPARADPIPYDPAWLEPIPLGPNPA